MHLKSLNGCKLSISNYPTFSYNAIGGGGEGIIQNDSTDEFLSIVFNTSNFSIPPLNWKTAKILGIPILPGLEITIKPKKLLGRLYLDNGLFLLDFHADFNFTIGNIFKAPDLVVDTVLTTNKVQTSNFNAQGMHLQKNGMVILVGSAIIQPTGNFLLDTFLKLPNEALAELHCQLSGYT